MAEENPEWFYQLLTVDDTWYDDPREGRRLVIRKEDVDQDRKSGMSEARVQQEYYCAFTGPLESAFYGDLMRRCDEENRICEVPWDVRFPVVTAWDLGIMDHTAVWYAQEVKGETRFIDYHEARDLSFEQHLSMVLSKPYAYVQHIGPHDLRARDRGTGHSMYEVARNFGVYFRCAPKLLIRDGIQAARAVLQRARFDADKCALGIQALREYRRQRDEANDDYLEAPVHDRWSHGADALRTYAIGRIDPGWQGGPRLFQPMSIV
jgi:hypothetical protein